MSYEAANISTPQWLAFGPRVCLILPDSHWGSHYLAIRNEAPMDTCETRYLCLMLSCIGLFSRGLLRIQEVAESPPLREGTVANSLSWGLVRSRTCTAGRSKPGFYGSEAIKRNGRRRAGRNICFFTSEIYIGICL